MFLSSNPTKEDYFRIMRESFSADGIMSDIHDTSEAMKLTFDKEIRKVTKDKAMKWWVFIPVWLMIFLSMLIISSSIIVRGVFWLVGSLVSCVYYTLALLVSVVFLYGVQLVLTQSSKSGTILNKILLTDVKK